MPRYLLPQAGEYHVTSRGVERRTIYYDRHDYGRFRTLLREVQRELELQVWAWCSMPNHFHLIVDTTIDRLSAAMYRLNGIYAQRFNARYDRKGHLFQSRFHVKMIGGEEHLANACDYVWNNPVRAGLCARADDWEWSGQLLLPRKRAS